MDYFLFNFSGVQFHYTMSRVIMFEEYGDMLSIDDVMEMLGIGRNSVYELLNSGELKGFRIKGKWKITKRAVVEYITVKSGFSK